jgi:hypothetical protein
MEGEGRGGAGGLLRLGGITKGAMSVLSDGNAD